MRSRGALVGVVLLALVGWPSAVRAQEAPSTTVPPTTTEAPPPPTTEAPAPTTTVPEVTPVPDEGTTSERTLTVRPRQNLVDGQVVVVRGRGWRPGAYLDVARQCRVGVAGDDGCGRATSESRVDRQGRFEVEFEVQVILDTPSGTYDCRLVPCTIRAVDRRSEGGTRSVRLAFDPSGPDPVREEATISPSTDLIDGQIVTVVGQDFDSTSRTGRILQCRLPVDEEADCDEDTESYAGIDRTGYLAETYRLEGLLRIDGADVDCRTTDCALLVGGRDDSLARHAIVPLDFDPDAPLGPPPTITITPDTDLLDGQIVDVEGEGLRTKSYLLLFPCRWRATDLDGCDLREYHFVKVRADGTFRTQFAARTILSTGRSDARVDCRVVACSLTAFIEGPYGYYSPDEGFGGGFDRFTRTRLRFDPDGPLLTPTFRTQDLDGVRAGSRWRISGIGGRPEGTVVLVQCIIGARTMRDCGIGTRVRVHAHFEPRGRVGIAWETRFRFKRHLHLSGDRQADCAVIPCILVAVDQGGQPRDGDSIATAFAT